MRQFKTEVIWEAGGRKKNEDYYGFKCLGKAGCWVLADGLGGHGGGEVASKTAVEKVLEHFQANPGMSSRAVRHYLEAAQNAIVKQQETPRLESMRTTIVLLLTDYRSVIWAHLGDSRLYYFRNGSIMSRTFDHSIPQVMANAGDITPNQIRFHEDRNRILRALGKEGDLRPSISDEVAIQRGDAFLLCTDGFWEYVTETEMEVDLAKSVQPKDWLKRMESRLLERAKGEYDNYTAISIIVN